MADLDRILQRRREATEALLAAEDDERRRAILSPPPAPLYPEPAHRIGLGGAVYRAGNRQINYEVPPPDYNTAARTRILNAFRRLDYGTGQYRARPGGWDSRLDPIFGVGDFGGFGMGSAVGGAGGAGRREDDVVGIISKVELPEFDVTRDGFTANFGLDEVIKPPSPIRLDEEGRIIKTRLQKSREKPYLACANCPEPLLISSAYRSQSDRVWSLRCGHMIDQRCLEALSIPMTEDELATVLHHPPGDLPILGEEAVSEKRGRSKRAKVVRRTSPPPPDEFEWRCPVKGCRKMHCSVLEGEAWVQKGGEGALQVYA